MMMYRTHCQRILDTVIRANFDEVYPPPCPFFYTPLIVQKHFCKIKNKTKQTEKTLIKTIIQTIDEIFFHVKFVNIFSRYRVSCYTSGRGCRNTWWRSWTRRRQFYWWEYVTQCCTRPLLTSSCRPSFRRYLTGELTSDRYLSSYFTMVGSRFVFSN